MSPGSPGPNVVLPGKGRPRYTPRSHETSGHFAIVPDHAMPARRRHQSEKKNSPVWILQISDSQEVLISDFLVVLFHFSGIGHKGTIVVYIRLDALFEQVLDCLYNK